MSWERRNRTKARKEVIDTKTRLDLASNETYFVAVVAKNSHGFASKAASIVIESPPCKPIFSHP